MTVHLKHMIAHYKNQGDRVDEVLFQEVMKVIERSQLLAEELSKRNNSLDKCIESRNYFMIVNGELKQEIERKDESLAFYADKENYATDEYDESAVDRDCGQIARQELNGGVQHEDAHKT